tara:strand:- start:457 stop:1428 length:972 start_codon:yes stop_codon:yes gene_type:complete
MAMTKILVTGAAGFIGSHLVEALLNLGHNVIGIDNFSSGKQQNIEYLKKLKASENFLFIEGDLRSVDFCEKICDGVHTVFHQAALGSVPRSIKVPQLYFENNLGGMVNLLDAARKNKVRRFIFASSSSVYGDTPTLPKVETMPLNPKSPYAVSKAAGEHYLKVYQDVYGIETIGFRYFNVFGPRQDPYSQYAAVIPKFFDQCLTGRPITINGTGDQTRDFTYINNVIQYNLKALNAPFEATNRVYNAGCGSQMSVLELAKAIQEITSSGVDIVFNSNRPGDVKDSLADLDLSNQYLKLSHIVKAKEGLKHTYDWYESMVSASK